MTADVCTWIVLGHCPGNTVFEVCRTRYAWLAWIRAWWYANVTREGYGRATVIRA